MALTQEEMTKIKEAFDTCARPFILFDSDHDGLSSFLMVYKHIKEGKGLPMKRSDIPEDLARKVNEFSPDLVVILDVPVVPQELLDQINARIIWIDHHPLLERKKVEYYNPKKHDPTDARPVSYWIYKILQEDLWIGMTGMIGDWHMPEDEIRLKFVKEYPDLLTEDIKLPQDALYQAKVGELVKIMNFNLKGKTTEVLKSVKVFTRIKTPYEILNQESAGGIYLFKKYKKLDEEYQEMMKTVNISTKEKLILFVSKATSGNSFTAEVSNALTYKYPDKLVISAWPYEGEYKCSLRSAHYTIPPMLKKALEGVSGYGGGHDHASGACIKEHDFDRFVENIRKQL